MSDPSYPAFPVLAFVAAAVILVPLPWHLQAWNAGTCLFMIWTSIACLNLGINSVVWHSNAIDYAPIWCDISSRIIVAVAVAIPAASLCINRRLYKIATIQAVSISSAQKRRAVIIDLSIGIGIPLLQIIMQYIVSGHRYDIFEDIGCFPFTFNTALAYPLSVIWPVVIGLVSAVYCVLTLRAFMKRRAQFSEFIASNASLNPNRYFRLMALATTELLCTTPIAIYGMTLNISSGVRPWISFADTHFHYSDVKQYPALLWHMDRTSVIGFQLTRWSPVFCAAVFVAFFGFAAEARKNYSGALRKLSGRLGIRFHRPFLSRSSKETLPTSNMSFRFAVSMPPPRTPSVSKFHMLSSSPNVTSTKSESSSFQTPVLESYKTDASFGDLESPTSSTFPHSPSSASSPAYSSLSPPFPSSPEHHA